MPMLGMLGYFIYSRGALQKFFAKAMESYKFVMETYLSEKADAEKEAEAKKRELLSKPDKPFSDEAIKDLLERTDKWDKE